MKIGIDLVSTNKNSGSKTYNINFVENLSKFNFDIIFYIFITKSLSKEIKIHNNKNIKVVLKSDILNIFLFRIFWMQIVFPFELLILRIQAVCSVMNYIPIILYFFKIKSILTIHSNLPWTYFNLMPGNLFKKIFIKKLMEISIKYCDILFCNSNYAKSELLKYIKINKNIFVNYLGCNHFKKNKPKKFFNKDKYILSVISCAKYHNILNLLIAYNNLIIKKKISVNLYFVLQIIDKEYYNKILNYINVHQLQKKVYIFNNLKNAELPNFYKNAEAYIFTSYSEVFGFTTLEAMNYNLPVAVSNKSALREINGKSAIYFNPDSIKEIEKSLIKILNNKVLIQRLKKNSKINLARYKWENHIKKFLNIIHNYL